MSYLTRVPAFEVLRAPLNPRSNHRDIMSLFGDLPEDSPRQNAQILFRAENDQNNNLLIRSAIAPVNKTESMQTIEEPVLVTEQMWVAYRLSVNAIRRRSVGEKTVVSAVPKDSFDEELADTITGFVERKFEGAMNHISVNDHHREILAEKGNGQGVTVQVDTINGVAYVQDPAKLAELLSAGVGRAKAYGCGLLTVMPINNA